MIKHIVCFKLKDNSEEKLNKAKEVLLSMREHVGLLWGIEVGVDFLHSARSYDVILQVVLENKEKLEEYQKNEYHCNVVKKYMHENSVSSVAIDYELENRF